MLRFTGPILLLLGVIVLCDAHANGLWLPTVGWLTTALGALAMFATFNKFAELLRYQPARLG